MPLRLIVDEARYFFDELSDVVLSYFWKNVQNPIDVSLGSWENGNVGAFAKKFNPYHNGV